MDKKNLPLLKKNTLPENMQKYLLSADRLYHASDLDKFDFASTADLKPLSVTIGQDRALDAINFAMQMPHRSFNLYVMGSSGLGRHELVSSALGERAEKTSRPGDWCYVFNYQNPYSPNILQLEAGVGRSLRADTQQLVDDLLTAIPAAFESNEYKRRYNEIVAILKDNENKEADALEEIAARDHIILFHGPNGFSLTPEKNGNALSPEEFDALPDKEQEDFRHALTSLN